jgi:hypothetical protein
MARRSILSAVREEHTRPTEPVPEHEAAAQPVPRATTKPSRLAKLHVGGYFDPDHPAVMAFQKLKVDLRRSQQDMLLEAMEDFVAKHQAAGAFR